jgi:hypothetical protein
MRSTLLGLFLLTAAIPAVLPSQTWRRGQDIPLVVAAAEARVARDTAGGEPRRAGWCDSQA